MEKRIIVGDYEVPVDRVPHTDQLSKLAKTVLAAANETKVLKTLSIAQERNISRDPAKFWTKSGYFLDDEVYEWWAGKYARIVKEYKVDAQTGLEYAADLSDRHQKLVCTNIFQHAATKGLFREGVRTDYFFEWNNTKILRAEKIERSIPSESEEELRGYVALGIMDEDDVRFCNTNDERYQFVTRNECSVLLWNACLKRRMQE